MKPQELYRVTATLYRRLGNPEAGAAAAEGKEGEGEREDGDARMAAALSRISVCKLGRVLSHPLGADRRESEDGGDLNIAERVPSGLRTPSCISPHSTAPSSPGRAALTGCVVLVRCTKQ